ncbi:hypothetical protein ACTXT7_009032 [Hymenolepis weldensis]
MANISLLFEFPPLVLALIYLLSGGVLQFKVSGSSQSKRLARSVRDARSHLLIYILRSVFSFPPVAPPHNCIMPWIIGIDLYSDNDLPLGAFLEHYCFRSLNCPNSSCRISMLDHVQRFTQAAGTLELTIQTIEPVEVPDDIESPIGTSSLSLHSILVGWYCPSCKQASQYHPISQNTWHLSFMKFVDLFMNSSSCFAHEPLISGGPICPIKDLHIYFAAGTRRVTFRHKPTMVFDVSMPPLSLWTFFPLSDPFKAQVYANSIIERHTTKTLKKPNAVSAEPVEMPDFLLKDVKETLKKYYEVVLRVKSHLVTLRNEAQSEDLVCLLDAFEQSLSLECAETGIKSRVEVLSFLYDNLSTSRSPFSGLKSTPVDGPNDASSLETSLGEEMDPDSTISSYKSLAPWMIKIATLSFEEKISLIYTLLYLIKRWLFNFVNDWNTHLSQYNSTVKVIEKSISKDRKAKTTLAPIDPTIDQTISRSQAAGSFQEISPSPSTADLNIEDTEASSKNITVGAVKRIITAILPGSSETKLSLDSWPPVEHPQILPPSCLSFLLQAVKIEPVSSPCTETNDDTLTVCAKEKLAERLGEIRILEVMPDVYVNDQEITSIVAYALATDSYASKLQTLSEFQANTNKRLSTKSSELQLSEVETKSSALASSSVSRKPGEGAISLDNIADDTEPASSVPDDTKSFKSSSVDPHIEIQFSDASTNFSCRIYYAEEFHQLRKLIFPQGEAGFIRSLSRCHNWAAKGGKSGSLFMKTHDERFVLKEVSSIELKTFHDIKDQYFNYLTTAVNDLRLSLLARILGIFNVEFKNTASGENRRLDVLVMENLFHNRPGITQIYDLKGCFRGRHVDTSADAGDISSSSSLFPPSTASNIGTDDFLAQGLSSSNAPVLLDRNFLNDTIVNPIYVRLHSKNALMHCLQADTKFLADLFIMDYSLLVGVDRVTGQLVMGIIDYLRKFTFNKRVEMIVKQAISSVQGPMPTIIMPVDYRDRLIEQMDRNFYLVPDQCLQGSKMAGGEVVPRTKGNLTVALVCDCFYPNIGGVESHIYQLAQCLLSRGHRVIVITHSYGAKWQRQGVRYMAKGLKVYYIPYRPFYCQAIFITVFGEISVVRDIFIRESVDVVHGHSAFSPLALESLMHAKAMGLSALFTDHSLFGFADLSSILANRALYMFLNVVDNFICVSNVAKENTVLRGHMEPERVYVIPNAIDSTAFTPDPSCRDPDNITVVIISRLVYRKGADLMAAIIPPMCHTFPNLRFIIGGDGPMRLALEEMRERYNLHFRVEMPGALPHHKVRDVLVRGDIFLNVSLTESFCIAIVEAASCGLLVVSTKVGGVPEVLPPHMMRLAPASASELASTLANAIEEVRQQRLLWSQETSPIRSVSQETLHSQEQSSRRAVSQCEESEATKVKLEKVENATGLNMGCPRIQRTLPPSWPPASAVEIAWQRHREIRQFYSWHDVARRTEIAYQAAMSRPRITPLEAARAAYRKLGPICGKIMAIAWIVDWILLIILEWLRPANTIDRVPYFTTTPSQFEMWNEMETSPFVETTTEIFESGSTPKKYTLKRRSATSARENSSGRNMNRSGQS